MKTKPDVEAVFEFIGYRENNVYEGYRPAHNIFGDYLTTGVHNYYNLEFNYDEKIRGTITFLSPEKYPNCLWIGKQISMYEGKSKVGTAIITKIFNPMLEKQ